MFILGSIVGINILGLIAIFILSNQGGYWDALIYPALDDILSYHLRDDVKKIKIIKILFTIVFLPAIIVYFSLMLITILLSGIFSLIKRR